ncbi:exonuclease domain-containing protein [Paenibacillus sp. TRM 82003]|nr:exonuclease domain-containing protein [Paenibacillus sp. TRM 82003]
MHYIVYDLEFTVQRTQRHLAEIIEIGAIRLEDVEGRLTMTDLFHMYVQPSASVGITAATTELTGITSEQAANAPTFPEASAAFRDWLGEPDSYYMCAWGPDDKAQLVRHCGVHRLSLDWIRNHNDIQLAFTRLQGDEHGKRWGLQRALTASELAFFGQPHRALDDAFNTAKLFRRAFPSLRLERNNAAEEPFYETALVYSTGSDDDAGEADNPFGKLAGLFGQAI